MKKWILFLAFVLTSTCIPSFISAKGEDTLREAASENDLVSASDTLEAGAYIDDMYLGMGPLHLAALGGHEEMIFFLRENGANVNLQGNSFTGMDTPLKCATKYGHMNAAVLLLKYGAKIDRKDLHNALSGMIPKYDIINLLITNGAKVSDLNHMGQNALTYAQGKEGLDPKILELLSSQLEVESTTHSESDIPAEDTTLVKKPEELLFEAARTGNLSLAKEALEQKAHPDYHSPNAGFREGNTALQVAASNGNVEMAQLLIDYKAEIDSKDSCGQTPLIYAAHYGNTEVARLLIKNGANINTRTIANATPAYLAARGKHNEVYQLLVSSGADIDIQADQEGNKKRTARGLMETVSKTDSEEEAN